MNFVGCSGVISQVSDTPACVSGWISFTTEQLKTELGVKEIPFFDFNTDAFFIGFGSIMTLFIVGLGSGFIISQLRKAKP
jgi:hypothetical protein